MPLRTTVANSVYAPAPVATVAGPTAIFAGSSPVSTDLTTSFTNTPNVKACLISDFDNGCLQLVGYDGGNGYQAYPARLDMFKTRSTSPTGDADTIVVSGDSLSQIMGWAANGSTYKGVAAILMQLDPRYSVSATSLPTLISFRVALNTTVTPISFLDIGSGYGFTFYRTNTAAGTTGAQTIDKPAGSVNIAAGQTTLVVTNTMCLATSNVFAAVQTNDTTAVLKNVVPAAGSFTITLTAAATAETRIAFWVTN